MNLNKYIVPVELKYGDVNYQRINSEASGRGYKHFVPMELLRLLKEYVNITSQMVYPLRKVFTFLSFRGTRNPRKKLLKAKLPLFVELLVEIPRSSE